MTRLIVAFAFFAALVVAWHFVTEARVWAPYVVPSPRDVGRYLREGLSDGTLVDAAAVTGRRLAIGYLMGLVAGLPLGFLTARFRTCSDTLGVLALGLQTLPSVCWVPLAILWFGQTEGAMLFVVVMGTLWSILIATDNAIRTVPPIYVRAARTMGSRGLHTLTRVVFPASLPVVLSGMKQGWAFAWRSLMAAEICVVVISGFGLGNLLEFGRDEHEMPKVVGIMFVIVVVGLAADKAFFAPAQRFLRRRWGTDS